MLSVQSGIYKVTSHLLFVQTFWCTLTLHLPIHTTKWVDRVSSGFQLRQYLIEGMQMHCSGGNSTFKLILFKKAAIYTIYNLLMALPVKIQVQNIYLQTFMFTFILPICWFLISGMLRAVVSFTLTPKRVKDANSIKQETHLEKSFDIILSISVFFLDV